MLVKTTQGKFAPLYYNYNTFINNDVCSEALVINRFFLIVYILPTDKHQKDFKRYNYAFRYWFACYRTNNTASTIADES